MYIVNKIHFVVISCLLSFLGFSPHTYLLLPLRHYFLLHWPYLRYHIGGFGAAAGNSEEIGLYNWTRIENTHEDVSSVATASSSTTSTSGSSSSLSSSSVSGGSGSSGASGAIQSVPVLSTILSGLDKFTEYEVVVQAYNQLGEGPTSSSSIAATLEDGK